MGDNGLLTNSDRVVIFVPCKDPDNLMKKIADYQSKLRTPKGAVVSRSQAVVELIRRGLERVKDAKV